MSHRIALTTQCAPVPDFDADVLVSPEAHVRLVYGSVALKAKKGVAAWVCAQVQTSPGSESWDTVWDASVDKDAKQGKTCVPFFFAAEGGRAYRFCRGNAEGAEEAVFPYSFVDL